MLFKKSSKLSIIAASVCMLMPVVSSAADLKITNNTDAPSTSVINGGFCSKYMPNGTGVTQPHSTNVVPDKVVKGACWLNERNCVADVYMTDDCSGPIVAKVSLNAFAGINSVDVLVSNYSIVGSGFEITIN
jgi:hypothetical protein